MIDLAIIGGGPAGTAAALEARRAGLTVALWERDRFPRDKVCGEFISAEALPLLEQEIARALGRSALIGRAEFIPRRGRVYGFALPGPARGLSRLRLDAELWEAARARGALAFEGMKIRRVLRASSPATSGAWELEAASGPTEPARALLVACGRWWAIEGLSSPAREARRAGPWVGAKAHFQGVARRDAVEMYFFSGGYCGLAPIEDGLYNACCLVHRSLIRDEKQGGAADFAAWVSRLARHPALAERWRGVTQVSATVTTAPVCMARRESAADGAVLAGDAAGFLDPFTGEGIAQALYGGRLAARAAARLLENAATESVIEAYRRDRARAVERSYRLAGGMRWLVRAPGGIQAAALAALPWLGRHLAARTRWRRE